MANITASSSSRDLAQAVSEIRRQLADAEPKTVIFFSSPAYEPAPLAAQIQKAFPGIVTWGCTTAGEIVSGSMLKHSLVAIALTDAVIEDCHVEVVEGLRGGTSPWAAVQRLGRHYGEETDQMDYRRYVGVVLIDGLSRAEERLMDQLGNLTNVVFVGGSAGDDLRFETTHVFVDGKSYTNAALLSILKPRRGFEILKVQSFRALDRKLLATKVDPERRAVLEFNHKPALVEYAAAIGTDPADAAQQFMHHPVGLMVDGEPFVRSIQRVDEQNLLLYCQVLEGTELSLLESTDIVQDTAKALSLTQAEHGDFSAILNFHCILRTLELEKTGRLEAYGQLFDKVPTVGFSTYGEAYFGHMNQTSTMLLLK
jgi:hypothetical protein